MRGALAICEVINFRGKFILLNFKPTTNDSLSPLSLKASKLKNGKPTGSGTGRDR